MKRSSMVLLAASLVLAASSVSAKVRNVTDPDAPRSLPADGPVAVQWTDPAEFSDIKYSGNRWEAQRGNWVYKLAEHMRKSAGKQLPAGERLEVTITDISRAGHYEPWHGPQMQDVRVLREVYPPRMELTFKRYDADGRLVAEGERNLRDMSYLSNSTLLQSNDNLRHEKRLIDDWLRDELRTPAVASN